MDYNTVALAADAALDLTNVAVAEGWTIHPDRNQATGPPQTKLPPRTQLREVFVRLNPNGMSFDELDGMGWLLRLPTADDDARWRLSAALMVAGVGWVARFWAAEGLCSTPQSEFSDYGIQRLPLGLLRVIAEGVAGVKAGTWPAPVSNLLPWYTRPKQLPLSRVTPHVQEIVRTVAEIQKNIDELPAAPGNGNVGADRLLFGLLSRLDWHRDHIPEPWPWDDPCMGEMEWFAEGCGAATSAHAGADSLAITGWIMPGSLGARKRFQGIEWQRHPAHWVFWHPAVRHDVKGKGVLPVLDVKRWSVRLQIEARRMAGPRLPPKQRMIMDLLNGKSLTLRQLADQLGGCDPSQLHRRHVTPLLKAHYIANDRDSDGYYRPDTPPK
jgi:hypothetical protein